MSELHVFAIGSLMYEPSCPDALEDIRDAVLPGWARAFDKRSRSRGCTDGDAWLTRGLPEWTELGWRVSLCLGAEPQEGAALHGKLLTYRGDAAERVKAIIDTREGVTGRHDDAYVARTLEVDAGGRAVQALTYVTNRESTCFIGGLRPEQIVEVLAHATPRERGLRARGVDYLLEAAKVLEAAGVPDPTLQELAAMARERTKGR